MDQKTEAQRLNLYYEGFNHAGTPEQLQQLYPGLGDDRNDPDYPQALNDATAFLVDIIFPLYHKLAYVYNNRLLHEVLSSYEPCLGRMLTAREIYDSVSVLAPYASEEILRTIGCRSSVMKRLLEAFNKHDYKIFSDIIDNASCDLRLISSIGEDIWPNIKYTKDPEEEQIIGELDAVASLLHDVGLPVSDTARELSEATEPFFEGGDEGDYLQLLTKYNRDMFDWLCRVYSDDRKYFKLKETRQIDPIILAGGGSLDSDFHLPKDYFNILRQSAHSDEYFSPHPDVLSAGPEPLERLVNHLAQQGYIENTVNAKRLFAYRFSGCMRPTCVEPLLWHGRNGRSYELIYLVRNLTERASYAKMRRFFTGVEWVKSNDSSYAIGAENRLKRYIQKLYPTLPSQL